MPESRNENQTEKPSNLIFEKDRLATFSKNWKDLPFKECTPKNFAAAGFYNNNTNPPTDTVKCFSCQKELSDWEENDDPWEEHVKRGNSCPFVLYKNKKRRTVKDFLQLQYETKKLEIKAYFNEQRKALEEQRETLLKNASIALKGKK